MSVNSEGVVVRFDRESHPVDALQRAAYRMCDTLAVEITRGDTTWDCELFSIDGSAAAPQEVAGFRTEVLDQVLRERIRHETAAERNLILALAFSGLVDQDSA